MVEVNFMPWRSCLSRYQARRFIWVNAAAFCLSGIVLLLAHIYVAESVSVLTARVQSLQAAAQLLVDKQSARLMLVRQTAALASVSQAAQVYQAGMSRLFGGLAAMSSHVICFTQISRHKEEVYFSGYVQSTPQLLRWLALWRESHVFSEMVVWSLRRVNNGHVFHFKVKAIERHPFLHDRLADEGREDETLS